jgi:hypothetical protein
MASSASYALDKALDTLTGNWPREKVMSADWLITFECALGVSAVFLIWALFFRRRRRRRGSFYRQRSDPSENLTAMSSASKPATRHRKRKRRHWRKNPTLAETGGLPPIRADQTSHPVR